MQTHTYAAFFAVEVLSTFGGTKVGRPMNSFEGL